MSGEAENDRAQSAAIAKMQSIFLDPLLALGF
jgi:hypothetical protein